MPCQSVGPPPHGASRRCSRSTFACENATQSHVGHTTWMISPSGHGRLLRSRMSFSDAPIGGRTLLGGLCVDAEFHLKLCGLRCGVCVRVHRVDARIRFLRVRAESETRALRLAVARGLGALPYRTLVATQYPPPRLAARLGGCPVRSDGRVAVPWPRARSPTGYKLVAKGEKSWLFPCDIMIRQRLFY